MQSMLASCKKKELCVGSSTPLTSRPKGNDSYVARAPVNPKQTRWVYHDDVSCSGV